MKVTVDVRTAVGAAQEYLQSIKDMLGGKIKDLRLEEVELSEDKRFWLITLGFDRSTGISPPVEFVIPRSYQHQRDYKLFKVDAETGEVQAMKIREL